MVRFHPKVPFLVIIMDIDLMIIRRHNGHKKFIFVLQDDGDIYCDIEENGIRRKRRSKTFTVDQLQNVVVIMGGLLVFMGL